MYVVVHFFFACPNRYIYIENRRACTYSRRSLYVPRDRMRDRSHWRGSMRPTCSSVNLFADRYGSGASSRSWSSCSRSSLSSRLGGREGEVQVALGKRSSTYSRRSLYVPRDRMRDRSHWRGSVRPTCSSVNLFADRYGSGASSRSWSSCSRSSLSSRWHSESAAARPSLA